MEPNSRRCCLGVSICIYLCIAMFGLFQDQAVLSSSTETGEKIKLARPRMRNFKPMDLEELRHIMASDARMNVMDAQIEPINTSRIVLNGRVNLLDKNVVVYGTERIVQKNLRTTVKWFPNAEVFFYDNPACEELILTSSAFQDPKLGVQLVHFFQTESFGAYKSDMCRLFSLYEHGGLYFDNDLWLQLPTYELFDHYNRILVAEGKKKISFATNINLIGCGFFQAFMASGPKNPVILRSIYYFLEFYLLGRTRPENCGMLGPYLLYMAWQDSEGHYEFNPWGLHTLNQTALFFKEMRMRDYPGDKSQVKKQERRSRGKSGGCDIIQVDKGTNIVVSFSRVEGTPHCHPVGDDYY